MLLFGTEKTQLEDMKTEIKLNPSKGPEDWQWFSDLKATVQYNAEDWTLLEIDIQIKE